jgi:hypothetical protein
VSADRLSILFFAAALLIGGTSVTALLLRLGAGPGFAQAVEVRTAPPSFAGVLASGSSSGTVAIAPQAPPAAPAPALVTGTTPARVVPLRAERVRLRAVRARARAERAAHAVLLAEAAGARSPGLVEGRRLRHRLVVVACPEAREAAQAAAAALSRRRS